MGSNSTAGSGSAFSSRLTQNPSGRPAAAGHNAVSMLSLHVRGGPGPRLRNRDERSDPSFPARQQRRRAAARAQMLAHRATETNSTRVDSSQWNVGRLSSEVERASRGGCTLHDIRPGPNYKTRIAGLPILYPVQECSLMAGLAPPNATQVRVVQADAVADFVLGQHGPIDDLADLLTFQNSSELIRLVTPLLQNNQSVCIGVYPSAAYKALEQWLGSLTAAGGQSDILFVHAATQPLDQAPPATEPQLSPRGSQLDASGGVLAVGLGLALWGSLTGFVLKLTKNCWGPRLEEMLGAYGCSIPCCNLQAVDDEEEEAMVHEFLGAYGYSLPACDPEQAQDEATSDSGSDAHPHPAPPAAAGMEAAMDSATARMTATPGDSSEDCVESLVGIDLDN